MAECRIVALWWHTATLPSRGQRGQRGQGYQGVKVRSGVKGQGFRSRSRHTLVLGKVT